MPQCRPPPHTSIHLSMSHAHQIVFNCGDRDPHGPSLPMFLPCVIQPVIQPVIHASVSHDDQNTLVSNHPFIYDDMSLMWAFAVVSESSSSSPALFGLKFNGISNTTMDAVSRATSK
ncbi:hypothetical protein J3459_007647 [Metarhizium acridum]|uniref:uncharacterized protein n=1 Tax=Metarhizium acridum TaxID=92637 RepID=UPI001C6C4F57|nr:hypothetical protein J3458_007108 [Metarhizium acridum]KAG8426980.1 hypothetical protein J3459_007647 [Metarhizium acridum]